MTVYRSSERRCRTDPYHSLLPYRHLAGKTTLGGNKMLQEHKAIVLLTITLTGEVLDHRLLLSVTAEGLRRKVADTLVDIKRNWVADLSIGLGLETEYKEL